MRILLTTDVFPPAIGGPATFGARLGEVLAQQGHKIEVCCATGDHRRTQSYPFPVFRAGIRGNRFRRELDLRAKLMRKTISADIIYCMGLEHQTAWACRLARKPFILRIGGDSVWEAARNMGITDLDPEAFYTRTTPTERTGVAVPELRRLEQLRLAGGVVYVSDYLYRVAGLWCPERPSSERIIRNGLSVEKRREPSRRTANEHLRLLFVGRQTNWKGIDAVLLALKHTTHTTLTIAGSGPAWPASVDLAHRLEVGDRTNFLRHVDSREVVDIMAEHHVLILPSLYEGLSNTLLEAGAAGIACIASDRGGNPEVIKHDETGFLVNPFNVNEIASAITLLAENEDLRLQLAAKHSGRVRSEFNIAGATEATIRFLENIR